MSDYREAWSDPQVRSLSYFELNVALAVAFILYSLALGWQSVRATGHLSPKELWRPLVYSAFVLGFSYRLFFLSQNALDDEWYAAATQNEPWDRSGYHLGLILDSPESKIAAVLLESRKTIQLRLPETSPRYQVVAVDEYTTRYSGQIRYEADQFVPYDDLETFLRNWTSLEEPR